MIGFENPSAMAVSETSVEATESTSDGNQTERPLDVPPAKKKRNLHGMSDPEAEVIALSPTSLLATNRFVCDICNKGFQRDQNLQLHRRGHNVPWKLKQRTGNQIRKRVYICPEKTCVHHDPLRALGDLTGIKKHFSRKHGEKIWKCDRCSKKYAVQSDCKAHMKICGSKEYKCDCGSMFSRRDSFITHRAFCDALAHESSRVVDQLVQQSKHEVEAAVLPRSCNPPSPPLTQSTDVLTPVISIQSTEMPENATAVEGSGTKTPTWLVTTTAATIASITSPATATGGNNTSVFAGIFASSATVEPVSLSLSPSLYLSNTANQSVFLPPDHDFYHQHERRYLPASQPALSATALLQKAAQLGVKSSNSSFLHALGLTMPSSPTRNHNQDSSTALSPADATSNITNLMMRPSAPTTLDFLGLGMSGGNCSSGGFSAYLSSIHAPVATSAVPVFSEVKSGEKNDWDDSDDKKPALH